MNRIRWGWQRTRHRIRPIWGWLFNSRYGRYWGRLGVWLLVNLAVLWWFQGHEGTPEEDRRLLAYIGGVYVLATVVMLRANKRGWRFESLGLLGTVAADAALYGLISLGAYSILEFEDEGRQDIVRTLLAVGGTQLALALVWWAITTRFGFRNKDDDR